MKLNWNFRRGGGGGGGGGGHTANPFQQQGLFPWGVWIFSGTCLGRVESVGGGGGWSGYLTKI